METFRGFVPSSNRGCSLQSWSLPYRSVNVYEAAVKVREHRLKSEPWNHVSCHLIVWRKVFISSINTTFNYARLEKLPPFFYSADLFLDFYFYSNVHMTARGSYTFTRSAHMYMKVHSSYPSGVTFRKYRIHTIESKLYFPMNAWVNFSNYFCKILP